MYFVLLILNYAASNVASINYIKNEGLSIDGRLILAIIMTFLVTLVVGVSIGVLIVLAVNKCRKSQEITLQTETEMKPPPAEPEDIKPKPHTHYGHVYSSVGLKQ